MTKKKKDEAKVDKALKEGEVTPETKKDDTPKPEYGIPTNKDLDCLEFNIDRLLYYTRILNCKEYNNGYTTLELLALINLYLKALSAPGLNAGPWILTKKLLEEPEENEDVSEPQPTNPSGTEESPKEDN